MIGTFLVLALAAVLLVTLAKSMFQIAKIEPNTVYINVYQSETRFMEDEIRWVVLNKIEGIVTLASPQINMRITVTEKQLRTDFKKLENL